MIHFDPPYNNIRIAIRNRKVERLSEGESPQFFSTWIKKDQTEIYNDKTGEFYDTSGNKAKVVIIFAGVGAGKTHFAVNDLRKHGSVFFNCSRTLIKEQQKEVLENGQKNDHELNVETSWKLTDHDIFAKALAAKYLVIDEFHHIFSDSFCDAPNYVFELLQNSRPEQTIILMSACVDYLTIAFEYVDQHLEYIKKVYDDNDDPLFPQDLSVLIGSLHNEIKKSVQDAPSGSEILKTIKFLSSPTCVIDVMNCCHNLHPREIKIIRLKQVDEILTSIAQNNGKSIYYCYSAKSAYKKACDAIVNGVRAVAITSSPQYLRAIIDRKISSLWSEAVKRNIDQSAEWFAEQRKIITSLNNLAALENDAFDTLKERKLPDDIDVIYTTSRMREGISIEIDKATQNDMLLYVFTESTDNVNLVQTVGRVRRFGSDDVNIDCYYAVVGGGEPKPSSGLDDFQVEDSDEDGYDQFLDKQLLITFFRHMFSYLLPTCSAYDLSMYNKFYFQDDGTYIDVNGNLVEREPQPEKPYRTPEKQRHNAQKIQTRINGFLREPGKVFMRPIRNPESKYIERYSIEINPLWRINYAAMRIQRNRWINLREFSSINDYKGILENIFPFSPVHIGFDMVDIEEVIEIIRRYTNRPLDKSDSNLLKKELVDIHFISPRGLLWHAINNIKLSDHNIFTATAANTKRQSYTIIENTIITDDSELFYADSCT